MCLFGCLVVQFFCIQSNMTKRGEIVGYTTGTFDILHIGHVQFLKSAKSRCDYLIVGLTTDDLGIAQKRTPIINWTERAELLRALRYVDCVVAHDGDTKLVARDKLKFDVLLIGDDYFLNPEYSMFEMESGGRVVYIPRTPGISTTSILTSMELTDKNEGSKSIAKQTEYSKTFRILSPGVQGPILHTEGTVVKCVHVGSSEKGTTSDIYKLPYPRPRNWKKIGMPQGNENLTGVNSNREVEIHTYIKHCVWNPTTEVQLAWESKTEHICGTMQPERCRPSEVWIIQQKWAGVTLENWWPKASKQRRIRALGRLKEITTEMKSLGVIHGDLHASNVCVDKDDFMSVIDFGWCLHWSFDMDSVEQLEYNKQLKTDFDWTHFLDSLLWAGIEYNDLLGETAPFA